MIVRRKYMYIHVHVLYINVYIYCISSNRDQASIRFQGCIYGGAEGLASTCFQGYI